MSSFKLHLVKILFSLIGRILLANPVHVVSSLQLHDATLNNNTTIMRTNKATLKAEIAHAEKMLKENPTAWHGIRAGWKSQATSAKRKLQAMEGGEA